MRTVLAAAAAVLLAGSAHAAVIVNGSFEQGINPGGFTGINAGDSTSITGWTVGGGGVDYIGSYWNASDGDRSVDLSASAPGSVAQSFATISGRTYTVTFDLSANPDNGSGPKTLLVSAGENAAAYSVSQSGQPLVWTANSFQFVALGSSSDLSFTSDAANGAFGPALDNVVVTLNAVPEPATWAMLITGFGLVGMAARRRRTAVAA